MNNKSHFIILFLLSICASICFVFAQESGPHSKYCQSENDILCKKCPINAKCDRNDFECNKEFLKNKNQCLFTSFSNETLYKMHNQLLNLRKKQNKKFKVDLYTVMETFNITEKEAKAVILYDEDFLINNNNKIIKKPLPLNSNRIRLLFLILSIVLVLVLLKPSYDKYGAFTLSILLYIYLQSSLDKLIKGLL